MGEVVQVPIEVIQGLREALDGPGADRSETPGALLDRVADALREPGRNELARARHDVAKMTGHLRDLSRVIAGTGADLDVADEAVLRRLVEMAIDQRRGERQRFRDLLGRAELSPVDRDSMEPQKATEMLGERFTDLIGLVNVLGETVWAVRDAVGLERVALTILDPKPSDGPRWRDHPALDETFRTVKALRKQKAVDDEAWDRVTSKLGVSKESGWKPVVEAIEAIEARFLEAFDRVQVALSGGRSPVDLVPPVPKPEQVDALVELVRDQAEIAAERNEAQGQREAARELAEQFQAELVASQAREGEQRTRALTAEGALDQFRTQLQEVLDAVDPIGADLLQDDDTVLGRVERVAAERDRYKHDAEEARNLWQAVTDLLGRVDPAAAGVTMVGRIEAIAAERDRALAEIEALRLRLESLRSVVRSEVPEGGPPPAEPRGMTWRDRYQRLSATHNAAARELYEAAKALGGEIAKETTSILVGASRVRELAQLRARDLERGRITDPELPTDAKLAVSFLDFAAAVVASGGYRRTLDRAAIFAVDEGAVLRVEIDGLLGRIARDDADEETLQDLVIALAFLEAVEGEPDRYAPWAAAEPESEDPDLERRCRVCGCTDDDCSGCVEKTGQPCRWVEADLCSACQNEPIRIDRGPGALPKPGDFVVGLDFGRPGMTAMVTVEFLPDGRRRLVDVTYGPEPVPARPEEEELEEPAEDPQVPIGAFPRKFRVEGEVRPGPDPDALAARVTAGIAEALRAGSSAEGRPVDEVSGAPDPTNPR